jgi:pilus assembly protein Flp/PilA
VQNLVDKYVSESDTVEMDDEGVVAIEYVVVAAAIVLALAALWGNFGTTLKNKLDTIVAGI